MTDSQEQGALRDAGKIIERFGGIRPMASKMAVPVTTVQGWKKRDIIPENRREDVLRAAVVNNIDLSDLIDKKPANENTGGLGEAAVAAPAVVSDTPPAPAKPAARAPKAPAASETLELDDDTQLKMWIRRAEMRAIQKSTLVTMIITALVTMTVIFVLFPGQERLNKLEQEVAQEQTTTRSGVPQALQDSVDQLQEQIRALRNDLNATAHKVDAVTGMNMPSTNAGELMDRVVKLESQVTALAGPGDLKGLADKIKNLQQTEVGRKTLAAIVSALATLAAPAQDPAQLDTVLQHAPQGNSALEQLMTGVAPSDIKSAVMLLVAAQLKQALEKALPVADDLNLLQKLAGKQDPALNDAVTQLAPEAAKGVETPKSLSDQFGGIAGQIVKASLQGDSVSVVDKAKAGLGSLLQVRKDGDLVSGTATQEKLDRVQQMLRGGDIGGAITELQSLPGDQQKIAQPFIDKAQVTLMTQRLIAMLTQRVSQQMGGAPSGLQYTTVGPGAGLQGLVEPLKIPGTGPDTTP